MRPTEKQQHMANETVRALYGSFDSEWLAELILIGEKQEAAAENPPVEVIALNVALRAELERRKMEATHV